MMMVDSRKGQQVVQLVGPTLSERNIIKSSISRSRQRKSSWRTVVIVRSDTVSIGPDVDHS